MLNKLKRKKRLKLVRSKPKINIGSVWLKNIIISFFFFSLGGALAYKLFDGGSAIAFLLKINKIENNNLLLNDEIDSLNLKKNLQQANISRVEDELKKLKNENNELQEEILFYEKIVGKRR